MPRSTITRVPSFISTIGPAGAELLARRPLTAMSAFVRA
jgi:hypothetical protein